MKFIGAIYLHGLLYRGNGTVIRVSAIACRYRDLHRPLFWEVVENLAPFFTIKFFWGRLLYLFKLIDFTKVFQYKMESNKSGIIMGNQFYVNFYIFEQKNKKNMPQI